MSSPRLDAADNGHFYAFWSDGRRSKRKSMGTKDRAVAEARFAQWILAGGHRAVALEDAGSVVTVADCWQVYKDEHVLHHVTSQDVLDYTWNNLKRHFGDLVVSDLSQKTYDSYLRKRTSGQLGRLVKPQTVRRELVALAACLNFCASPSQKLIPMSAVPKTKLPPEGEPRDRWLRDAEIDALFDAARRKRRGSKISRGERFLWLALETAARRAAILELTWDRVDFETNVVDYNVPGRKRTKKRRAVVPISARLRPVLLRAYEERENNLVMTNAGSIWATIQLIAIEAGIGGEKPVGKEKPKATGVSPHVLRHTAATHMARRGVSLWKIAKILGNTVDVVERVYAKHSPDDLREAVDLISSERKS